MCFQDDSDGFFNFEMMNRFQLIVTASAYDCLVKGSATNKASSQFVILTSLSWR